jgi:pyruvate/2-oxoglutarate dehydrogenase complex dihydrolipoamide dehydrogenase (E3) component
MGENQTAAPLEYNNERLLDNVRPDRRTNPKAGDKYHLVVIGAGTAGLVSAVIGSSLGARTALVERNRLGGDCLNWGCVPSKALIRSARAAYEAGLMKSFGIHTEKTEVDFSAVMERVRGIRADISSNDSVKRLESLGVDVFFGNASFSGPDRVDVEGQTLHFRRAVIATGARPVIPPVEGLKQAGCLTNEKVFDLTHQPEHLVILGAGPIGCEMAQAFRRLGSRVSIIERGERILSKENPEVSRLLQEVFEREGIEILTGTRLKSVKENEGEKQLILETQKGEEQLVADEILVGAGRTPNVPDMGLEKAGVEFDPRKGIQVDDYFQTTNRGIFAAGDVCLKYKFTHTAEASASAIIQNAFFFGRRKKSAWTIPWCTYTDPEVAHTGLSEDEIKKRGIQHQVIVQPLEEVDRARTDGEAEGFLRLLVGKRGRILGATLVSRHAGESISEITLAIEAGVSVKQIMNVIHPYPTQAEVIKKAAVQWNQQRVTPRVRKLFDWWFGILS